MCPAWATHAACVYVWLDAWCVYAPATCTGRGVYTADRPKRCTAARVHARPGPREARATYKHMHMASHTAVLSVATLHMPGSCAQTPPASTHTSEHSFTYTSSIKFCVEACKSVHTSACSLCTAWPCGPSVCRKLLCRRVGYTGMEHTGRCVYTHRAHTQTLPIQSLHILRVEMRTRHTQEDAHTETLPAAGVALPVPCAHRHTNLCAQAPPSFYATRTCYVSPRALDSACDAHRHTGANALTPTPSVLRGRSQASPAMSSVLATLPELGVAPCTLPGPGGSPGRPGLHPLTVRAAPGGHELSAGRNTRSLGNTAAPETPAGSGPAQARAAGMVSPPARRSGLRPQAWSRPSEARRALSPPRRARSRGTYRAGAKSSSSGARAVRVPH